MLRRGKIVSGLVHHFLSKSSISFLPSSLLWYCPLFSICVFVFVASLATPLIRSRVGGELLIRFLRGKAFAFW
jgi:hypothetical protein